MWLPWVHTSLSLVRETVNHWSQRKDVASEVRNNFKRHFYPALCSREVQYVCRWNKQFNEVGGAQVQSCWLLVLILCSLLNNKSSKVLEISAITQSKETSVRWRQNTRTQNYRDSVGSDLAPSSRFSSLVPADCWSHSGNGGARDRIFSEMGDQTHLR